MATEKFKCHLVINIACFLIHSFIHESPLEVPIEDGKQDNVFISRSYDATSHFETVCDDVHDMWRRITGEPLVLKKRETEEEVNAV